MDTRKLDKALRESQACTLEILAEKCQNELAGWNGKEIGSLFLELAFKMRGA